MTVKDAEFYERFVEEAYGSDCHAELGAVRISNERRIKLASCKTAADLVKVLKECQSFGHMDSIIYQLLLGNDESKES